MVLGRSPQVTYCIDDSRVSRSHARIDWHGGAFQLTDLSFNGTYVRFSGGSEIVRCAVAPARCTAAVELGLGASPNEVGVPVLQFSVMSSLDDTMPMRLPPPANRSNGNSGSSES